MTSKEGYDVLRLIEHGQTCYISSEYIKGKILVSWLKMHPNLTKERLFLMIREITNQLCMIHKCRKKPYYQYVNPYSIVITEEGEVYFLDLEAGSNEERIRYMRKRAIREAFLPPQEAYYQKASMELDMYGLGKTIQYLLAMARPIPALNRREEKKYLKIISKCLNDHSRLSYRNVSEIRRNIPKCTQKIKHIPIHKKQLLLIGISVFILSAVWKVQGMGGNELEEIEKGKVREVKEEEQETAEDKSIKTRGNEDENVYMELAMLYILDVEDYEKSLYYLEKVQGEHISVRKLKAVAEALLGKKDNLKNLENELENNSKENLYEMEEDISEENFLRYCRCIIKGNALLDTEQSSREILSFGKECIEQMEDGSAEEIEVKEYMASASEKTGETEEAARIYEEILEAENDAKKREEIYRKLSILYENCGQNDRSIDACIKGIREIEGSEELRIMHIRLLCKDISVERVFCAQTVREYIQQLPGILEREEFQKLQREYEIQVEGENVWVGR